jgi:hypothetical protein
VLQYYVSERMQSVQSARIGEHFFVCRCSKRGTMQEALLFLLAWVRDSEVFLVEKRRM